MGQVIVSQCALCRRVRDEQPAENGQRRWLDVMRYVRTYRLRVSNLQFSETFCEECDRFYDQLMRYGRDRQSVADQPRGEQTVP
jgi:hypothetical protein